MKHLLIILLFALASISAQTGSSVPKKATENGNKEREKHCALFYLSSSKTDIIPFDEYCFVYSHYDKAGFDTLRFEGPVDQHSKFFTDSPWFIEFVMPPIDQNGRVKVSDALSFASGNLVHGRIGKGKYGKVEIEYVSMNGSMDVKDFKISSSKTYFVADFSMIVRERTKEGQLVGPLIRVKGTLITDVKNK